MTTTADPHELLDLAVGLVRRAGALAREMRADAIHQVGTKSTPTDVVTAADSAAERLVREALLSTRPGDRVFGEEAGDSGAGRSGVRWLLDPIDGTVNYLYGLPQYAVSLAAEVDGDVVAGVVRCPVTGDEWTAVRGEGAYHADRRLHGSAVTDLGQTLVATGFAYDARRRAYQARVLTGVLPRVRDIRRFGSAALDLCHAAEGLVDAYYERGLSPWDHAAGGLIAAEAGLRVTGLHGQPAGAGFLLAAPPGVADALGALLTELAADQGP